MAETGFINNGSLVQYGQGNTSDSWDYLIEDKAPLRILISGDLPNSKDGSSMNCSFYSGTIPLFSAAGTWGIQGQSSVNSSKKNWKLKLINPKTGKKLKVKFGDWFPSSSITLKGYGTDRTLLRDTTTTRLWRNMYSTHFNGLLSSDRNYNYFKDKNCASMTSALFTTDGSPVELYFNDQFLGMYVIRSDVDNDTFLMDPDNPNHIQTQPQKASNFWLSGKYTQSEWDFYCPGTVTADTTQKLQDFITWACGCVNGTIDLRSTYHDHIDLKSWIDYILLCEVSASYDSIQNNFEMATWNGTDANPIWSIFPYDEDETFGIVYGKTTIAQTDPLTIGWVMREKGNIGNQHPVFFEKILDTFWGEVRDRYYYLRSNKILDTFTFDQMIKSQVDLINPKSLEQDLKLWSATGQTGFGTGLDVSDYGRKWSFVYIKNFFSDRLKWLDQQFNI
ncbi:CotH kinase family protein [Commensalibacter papalotli (ex Servin-Garciduenas et al. 2014)]|uniref:CotH protein n=1 Tax=Commensalibacter papalotli (ex Servin-Garciduenas et al. 2014) TaxID=1208583 RepID=W7E6Q4_9PROT|nr:CotH kinase family protein [Commensalibacter papalotli (ex Servin-Garciduenas et al. 2014)]EUK18811.1 hypothetical protein COMX_03645 [Commensalibacter papalotli (ex Servin-Garciduenas et al. 2014)]